MTNLRPVALALVAAVGLASACSGGSSSEAPPLPSLPGLPAPGLPAPGQPAPGQPAPGQPASPAESATSPGALPQAQPTDSAGPPGSGAAASPSFLELPNLSAYSMGARLVRSSAEDAVNLLNEWPDDGWSVRDTPASADAVVELASRAQIRGVRLVFDRFWAVRLPERFEVALGDSQAGPFTEIARLALPETLPGSDGEPLFFDLPVDGAQGRYVQVTLHGRRGGPDESLGPSLSLLEVHGTFVEPPATGTDFVGPWTGGWLLGQFRVVDDGGLRGCFADGRPIDVTVDGRTLQLRWAQDDGGRGLALLVRNDDGTLVGTSQVWSAAGEGGEPGNVQASAVDRVDCDLAPRRSAMEEALERDRRVRVYGIQFDFGLDVPRPEAAAVIAELGDVLTRHAGWQVTIEGHTDAVGQDAANQSLSERRAASVVAALVARGIDASRLTSAGFGEGRPVASNDTAPGRAQNRRVEITLR